MPNTSGTAQTGLITRFQGNGGTNGVLDIGNAGAGTSWIQVTNRTNLASNYPLLLNPNGGNVGIGTAGPGSKLAIAGAGSANGITLGADQTLPVNIYYNTSPVDRILQFDAARAVFTNITYLTVPTNTYFGANLLYTGNNVQIGGTSLGFKNATNDTSVTIANSGATGVGALAIMNGNVGIGTAAPEGKLHILGDNLAMPNTSGTAQTGLITRFQGNGGTNGVLDIGNAGAGTSWIQVTNRTNLASNYPLLLNPNGGNVGIGTTNPTTLLSLYKNTNGFSNSAYTQYFKLGTDTINYNSLELGIKGVYDAYIASDGNDLHILAGKGVPTENHNIHFYTGFSGTNGQAENNERMTILSNGNVGIGTTAPVTNLHIQGSIAWDSMTGLNLVNGSADYGRAQLRLIGRFQAGNDGWAMNGRDSILFAANASVSGAGIGALGTDKFAIQYQMLDDKLGILSATGGGTPLMVFQQNGNVGIGTAAPGYKLEIGALSGSVEPTSLRIRGSATNVTQIRIGDDYSASVGTLYSGANAFLASNAYQNTLGTANWSKEAPTYASAIAVLGINPTLTIPAFQIKSSPANTASGTYGSFFTSDLFTVLGNGNVGIGTTGPKGKLHTVGINATPTNMAYLANGYSPLYVQSRTDATYGLAVFDANTNTAIQSGDIANGASPTALILNPFSGNVGIGTTNPLGKLTVRTGIDQNLTTTVGSSYGGANGVTLLSTDDGNTAYKDLTVASGNFIINASGGTGNVGIGTSAPGAKLDVNGGIHVAGSSPSAGITLVSKEGYKEVWQLTQGKYTFAFGTLDFYGMMIIRAYGTNYSQGTSEIRVGEWVIPLRYAQSRSLQNIWNYGNVFTNIYNTNGLGLMWANVDNYNSTLTIFNSGSSGPDSALMVQLEFYSSTNGLSGIFTRTSYTDTAYTTNPY